jgi:hypothetical protein
MAEVLRRAVATNERLLAYLRRYSDPVLAELADQVERDLEETRSELARVEALATNRKAA